MRDGQNPIAPAGISSSVAEERYLYLVEKWGPNRLQLLGQLTVCRVLVQNPPRWKPGVEKTSRVHAR